MTTRVLIVDDEPPIRKLLGVGLKAGGFAVVEATNGRTALDRMEEHRPDVAILDLGLPDMPGQEVLARWRAAGLRIPVVILSSRTDEGGIVEALELGADDYVTKPFGMQELLARLRVALRNRAQAQGEVTLYRVDGLEVDVTRRTVRMEGRDLHLTPKEYDLLCLLVQHAGRVLTHKFLLDRVWEDTADVQYLRVYMRQLRQKIEPVPDQPRFILTETGIGYRMRAG
ncbi:response regulator transcription factor [Falsirhodobacter xinxiangensis]|uniref:response regulator transcription factor n=1 Tax=Falsirhodobacter xinxiangensis TaxID=2530049 RepID=UPI0010AA3E6F|nr:response regulator transcription factor [Rhodobacter xinxiangensis]